MLLLLATMAFAVPCNDGWESPSTGSGTCSHHGGVHHSYYVPSPVYIPTPTPVYVTPMTSHTVIQSDQSTLEFVDGVNGEGTLRWYGVASSSGYPAMLYACWVDKDHNIDESISFAQSGSWNPGDTKITGISAKVVTGNEVILIKYWYVSYYDDRVIVNKTTAGLVPGDNSEVDPAPLTCSQVQQIINSDSIFIGKDNSINITIPKLFASAARQIWTKCNQ